MITPETTVELELDSLATNVMLVRSVINGFAEITGLGGEMRDRILTTVSEAANNVVLHAYDHGPGSLRVSITAVADHVDVLVADRGHGIRPALPSDEHMGLGLAVISVLADRAEFSSGPAGGTEVRLRFLPGHERDVGGEDVARDVGLLQGRAGGLDGDVVVSLAPAGALGEILGRLSRALAAQWHFRVDRLDDLRTVTNAIAAAAGRRRLVGFAVTAEDRRLEITVGPLPETSLERVAATPIPGSGATVAELTDALSLAGSDAEGEYLRLLVLDAR